MPTPWGSTGYFDPYPYPRPTAPGVQWLPGQGYVGSQVALPTGPTLALGTGQGALGAASSPLALGAGGNAALSASPQRLALNPGFNAGQAFNPSSASSAARGAFIPETQFARQLGGAVGQPGLRGSLSTLKTGLKGKIGPAIGYQLAGQAAAAGLRSAFKDEPAAAIAPWEEALKWGGTGAAIGSIVPGAGTVIGGLAGATLGTAKGIFMGPDVKAPPVLKLKDRPRYQLNKMMKAEGVPKGVQKQAREVYADAMAMQMIQQGSKRPSLKKSLKMQTAAANEALAFVGEKMAGKEQAGADDLATQALAAQFLGPILADQAASNNALAGLQEGMAGSLPPEYQNLARVQGATTRSAQNNMAAAYANQMALIPGLKALEQQQAQDAQLAQQAYQAQLQDQAGGGGGGAQSLEDALAAAGAGKKKK